MATLCMNGRKTLSASNKKDSDRTSRLIGIKIANCCTNMITQNHNLITKTYTFNFNLLP